MRLLAFVLVPWMLCVSACSQGLRACTQNGTAIDAGWRFHLGDVSGAERTAFDDADWSTVDLPHDWSVQQPFVKDNNSGGAGAFAPMGVAWYRLRLPAVPAAACNNHTVVQFDGVMANSDVWINSHLLGHRPSGYVSFRYDLTEYLNREPGNPNVLTVRTDTSEQPSSRFYQGAGIYRHVHLYSLPAMHITGWSTVVRTQDVSSAAATVFLETRMHNEASQPLAVRARVTIFNPAQRVVAHSTTASDGPVPVGASPVLRASMTVRDPELWDLKQPRLYRARVELLDGHRLLQTEEVRFGIREMHFDAAKGFFLNGQNLKIKGVALHSDVGALGMAAPLSLWRHRLQALRGMGVNAIRTAHNPVSPEFLDLCDETGLLVLDETFDQWSLAKVKYDYHLFFPDWATKDLAATVRRDRNHPSIFAWSAGNEIRDTTKPDLAKAELASLLEVYHREDPTRPVTQALFRPNASHDYDDGLADMLDVVGQNYRPGELLAAHAQNPSRKILGTENIHDRATWLAVRDHPEYSGMFVWAGVDYLGESRKWPIFANAEGLLDRTDYPKPDALEHASWWAPQPVLHLVRRTARTPVAPTDPGYELEQYRPKPTVFSDWSPADRLPHPEQVEVYSNCKQVALLLNGKDLGSEQRKPDDAARSWTVTFTPGTLQAHCIDQPAVQASLRTAEAPAQLRLEQESSLGSAFDDVTLVRVTVVDRRGTPVPGAAVRVTFSLKDGDILATDDADTVYHEPFQSTARTTVDGRVVVYLRARPGKHNVVLRAITQGMPEASLSLH